MSLRAAVALVLCVVTAGPSLLAGPLASSYNLRIGQTAGPTRVEKQLFDLLNRERIRRGRLPFQYGAALSRVAREHSTDMVQGKYFDYFSPTLGSIEYRLHRAGISTVGTTQVILRNPSAKSALESLKKDGAPFLLSKDTHLGLGVRSTLFPRGHTVTLLAAKRLAELDPFPTRSRTAQTAVLSGKLLFDLKDPQVAVTLPDGSVSRVAALAGSARGFRCVIAFDKGPGEYTVEVVATGRLGSVVADIMRVYVDVPYPSPDVSRRPDREVRSVRSAEKRMLALVNETRKRHGEAPLVWHERLARVARAHSEDMMAHGFFAHVSPGKGDLNARIHVAGLRAKRFAENIAQNRSLLDAHHGLMESPVHRKNLLDKGFTHVGIGMVQRRDGQLFITQNFSEAFVDVDVAAAPAALIGAVNKERFRLKRRLLIEDRVFTEIALANSREMQRTDTLSADRAKRLLDERKPDFRSCRFLVYVHSEPPTPSRMPQTLKDGPTAIGVGMVQGDSHTRGPGQVWTTVILVVK